MKRFLSVLFLIFLLYQKVWGNEFYNSAPGFTVPIGSIAYLGAGYNPLPIWKTGSSNTTLKTRVVLTNPPSSAQAISEVQDAVIKNAVKWKLDVEAVPTDIEDQRALLRYIFHPAQPDKFPFSLKKLSSLAGGKPYVLIELIDYYATFGCGVNIRESQDGKKINYSLKRSILEQNGGLFSQQGFNKVGAFEIFLVSTKDGSLLWQANGCDSFQHTIFNSFKDTADHEMDKCLRTLAGKK